MNRFVSVGPDLDQSLIPSVLHSSPFSWEWVNHVILLQNVLIKAPKHRGCQIWSPRDSVIVLLHFRREEPSLWVMASGRRTFPRCIPQNSEVRIARVLPCSGQGVNPMCGGGLQRGMGVSGVLGVLHHDD